MNEKAAFEGWAIIELFGHNQIAGYLSEQAIGGASFVRVECASDQRSARIYKVFRRICHLCDHAHH